MTLVRIIAVAIAGVFALSGAAYANVDVDTDIEKDKTIFIEVFVNIDKDVDIDVNVNATPAGAAESDITVNQENFDNDVDVDGANISALIDGSVTGTNGITQINQSPGGQNNQGNVTSVAASVAATGGIFTGSQVHAEQDNEFNDVEISPFSTTEGIDLDDTILNSFNTGSGISNVNQSAGFQNNQFNGVGIAVGDEALVAFSEADLGQDNFSNDLDLDRAVLDDTIMGSLNGYSGIANVNQSAGFQNNQANLVSISVNTGFGFSPTPGTTEP